MIHAVLRLGLLCLNVLDSFKVMKAPKARKGHAPSERAVTARKRDMKGMMCVWVVCACWLKIESICDRTLAYLMPFYGEVKTMCFLFLLFGRASAAEPITIKYIRPAIKPYAKTIDSTLELLSMIGAFAGELAAGPLQALEHRWQDFNNATKEIRAAANARDSAFDDIPIRGRNRRFSVFSFWRDNDEAPLDLQVAGAGGQGDEHSPTSSEGNEREGPLEVTPVAEARRVSKDRRSVATSGSQTNKPLPAPPAPDVSQPKSGPRLGYVSAAMPSYERQPSQASHQAEILHVAPESVGVAQMRDVVSQANGVYGEIKEVQENARPRLRTVRTVRNEPHSSGSSSTHQARPAKGRAPSSEGLIFQEALPEPPAARSPPGTSYIPAPPPAERYVQSSFDENASWGYRRNPSAGSRTPDVFPGHMSPPPSEHPFSTFPPQAFVPTVSYPPVSSLPPPRVQAFINPPSNDKVDAHSQPPSDPFERARRRPPPIKSIPSNDHHDRYNAEGDGEEHEEHREEGEVEEEEDQEEEEDEDEDEDEEEPFPLRSQFRPATPPSQYLGPLPSARTIQNEEHGADFSGHVLLPETPMAPGGFAQWDLNSEAGNSEYDDGEVGPDDSISMRGAHRPVPPHHGFFAPSQAPVPRVAGVVAPLGRPRKGLTLRGIDTRPTTVNDFEQLRLELEAEEAEAEQAEAIRAALEGQTSGPSGSGAQTPMPAKNRKSNRISNHLPGYFPLTPGYMPPEEDAPATEVNVEQIANLSEQPVRESLRKHGHVHTREPTIDPSAEEGDPREFGAREVVRSGNVEEVEELLPPAGSSSKSEIKRLKKVIEDALAGKGPIQLPSQVFEAPLSRQRPTGDQPVNAHRSRPTALHIQPVPPVSGPPSGTSGASRIRRNLQTIEESVSVSLGDSLRGGRSDEDEPRPRTDTRVRPATAQSRPKPVAPTTASMPTYPRSTRPPQPSTTGLQRGSATAATGSTGSATMQNTTRSKPMISQKRSSSDMGREDRGSYNRSEIGRAAKDNDDSLKKKRRVFSAGEAQREAAMSARGNGRPLGSNTAGHVRSASSSVASAPDVPQPMVLSGGRHVRSSTERVPDYNTDELGQMQPKARRRAANVTQ
ncbi:hypothetical protein FRB93_011589 [Tulasnella sp. JGI-2019a]|nr:hypothetical protein FRB93_011589 [Tulasnella sp. JGI-2019a]